MRKMSEIRKAASMADLGRGAAKGLLAGVGSVGALALGSAMANVLERKIQSGMSNLNKGRHYKNMLEENKIKDGVPAQRAFRTLHNFAPSMAADPMVAGTFVRRVVDYDEMIDPAQVKQLVDVEEKRTKGTFQGLAPTALSSGFNVGFKGTDPFKAASAIQGKVVTKDKQRGPYVTAHTPGLMSAHQIDVADAAKKSQYHDILRRDGFGHLIKSAAQLRRARVMRNRIERGEAIDKVYGS